MGTAPDPYPSMRYAAYGLILSPDGGRVLLVDGADGPELPCWETTTAHFWQTVEPVNAALGAAWGVPLTTLRPLGHDYDPYKERLARLYLMEAHASGWEPPAPGRWADPAEVATVAGLPAEWEPLIAAALAEVSGVPAPETPPWARPGWWATVVAWIAESCRGTGAEPEGAPVQVRTWGRSCVIRQATAGGDFYFKAVPPMFAHEPGLTVALAAADPAHFPQVVALDAARGWMLMRAFVGVPLATLAGLDRWETAMRAWADVQIRTTRLATTLRAAGCPDRRLPWLEAELDPFFAELARYAALRPEEIAALRALAPDLHDRITRLAALDLPATLDHGDLGPWNIISGPGPDDVLFFDLSDSSLAHPFLSLPLFLADAAEHFPTVPDAVARLRTAYLQPWAAMAPTADLADALTLAAPLAPLHHALIYHTTVLPGLGPAARWQMAGMVSYFLRLLLAEQRSGAGD
jgi:hypothetical protein